MYELYNEFAGQKISRHRTARAAFRAMREVSRAIRRREGSSSFLPMSVRDESGHVVENMDYDLHI